MKLKLAEWDEVDAAIRLRGQYDLKRQEIETLLNQQIETIKSRHAKDIERLDRVIADTDEALEAFAAARRDEMAKASEAGGLVWRGLFGKVAFRKLPPKIKFTRAVAKVLAALKAARLTDCIRTTEEPNKEVLLALDDATLKTVHAKKVGGEQFEVVPDYEEIRRGC